MTGVDLEWGNGDKEKINGSGIKLNFIPNLTEGFAIYGFSDDISENGKIREKLGVYIHPALAMLAVVSFAYVASILTEAYVMVATLGLITGIVKIFDEMKKRKGM